MTKTAATRKLLCCASQNYTMTALQFLPRQANCSIHIIPDNAFPPCVSLTSKTRSAEQLPALRRYPATKKPLRNTGRNHDRCVIRNDRPDPPSNLNYSEAVDERCGSPVTVTNEFLLSTASARWESGSPKMPKKHAPQKQRKSAPCPALKDDKTVPNYNYKRQDNTPQMPQRNIRQVGLLRSISFTTLD